MIAKENINNLFSKLTDVLNTLKNCEITVSGVLQELQELKEMNELQESKTMEVKEVKTDNTPKETPPDVPAIADKFQAHVSLNDKVARPENLSVSLLQPVNDIAKAIGINDRFMFIKELCDGDTLFFTQIINKLNKLNNMEEAKEYIRSVIKNWDSDSKPAQLFLSIIQRRYI